MSTLPTQEQLEISMAETGYASEMENISKAEEHGDASRNPYAATLYRNFVQPLAALVQRAQNTKGPAANAAHVALLRPLDPWGVAFITVRTAINNIMSGDKNKTATVRGLMSAIGKAVHAEMYLTQFAALSPELFFIISEDLARRKAKNIEHKLATFKLQAKSMGQEYIEWGIGARDQVGAWLLQQLKDIGFAVADEPKPGPGKRPALNVYLSSEVQNVVDSITENVALLRPFYAPCVEPPKRWLAWSEGGWHTKALRRVLPHPVKARAAIRGALAKHRMPKVLECLNVLQEVPWKINQPVLDAVLEVSRTRNVGEIVLRPPESKPTVPEWLNTIGDGERTPQQEQEFADWKAAMTDWYTLDKLQRAAKARLAVTLRTAKQYREYPEFFFVHFCDSRGRVYPMSQGLSPQGSDLQKGIIHFAKAKRVHKGTEAERWLTIQGANKFGFDKARLDDRAAWHLDKADLICRMADDPVQYQEWLDCDNPVQFLAWCMEYRDLQRDGYVDSRLPVSLDGSCSGLQHFSAMLRDEVGGRATNLLPSLDMQDIYGAVAKAATVRMEAAEDDPEGMRAVWLKHGITRAVTKRAVMTTPYGVTVRSATKYVIEDYLRSNNIVSPKDYYKAAAYLMKFVWPAIGDIVVKGRQAMTWLEKAAKSIIDRSSDTEGAITWVTPSGFLASQAYYDVEEQTVNTKLYGHARILVLSEADAASKSRHASGMAPNFVHSMDASHLHLTTVAMAQLVPGVSLAMIHDDFGTHAVDTPILYKALRHEFISMYEQHDPLRSLALQYDLPDPPSKGKLDLSQVLHSEFVFS